MSFLAPALLGGLGLLSVPIIIHILNRRKFRVVEWAPMKYLRLTVKTTRRRIRLEQLLLLLVRLLFVAALIFALARPVVQRSGALSWAGLGAKTSRILVLDDSLSMGSRLGNDSSWQLLQSAAQKLIGSMPEQDGLTLILASQPSAPLLSSAAVGEVENAAQLVEDLELGDASVSWAGVFEALQRLVEGTTYPVVEITILTDLRRTGWGPDVEAIARAMAAKSLNLRIIDLGLAPRGNIALIGFDVVTRVCVPEVDVYFSATIRNDGSEPFGPIAAELLVDDAKRSVSIPRIAAGETVVVELAHRFRKPGLKTVALQLPADDLPGDNRRQLVVHLRESLDLLLVDGQPSDEPFESEVDFLSVAYTVGDVPWRVYAATDAEWLSNLPSAVDLTVLANLGNLTPEHVSALEDLVRDGMGLMIFPGEESDLSLYNTLLWREGEGLLPARLTGIREEAVEGMAVEPVEHSPLQAIAKLAPEALASIGAKRFLEVAIPAASDEVRVLSRWDDQDRSPAAIERRFGKGRVILWTTTADRDWTDWPIDPSFILTMREAGLATARQGLPGLNWEAGQTIQIDTNSRSVDDPRVALPWAKEPARLSLVNKDPLAAAGSQRLSYAATQRAGIYRAEWTDESGTRIQRPLAVSPAASESDLRPVARTDLLTWLGSLSPQFVHHSEVDDLVKGAGREIWRILIGLTLAFLALESGLMVWVGRKG
ncbi:MAG: BatA domain-containing protein [Planctomycetota bacterium]